MTLVISESAAAGSAAAVAAAAPSVELTTNGVGPWPGELPTDEHFDSDLLASGDSRNVIDRYRYWNMAAIIADLDAQRHPFHVAIENWQHDMNIGSIVRSANAFGAHTVHIIGRRRWNKRGAMVTDRYQHVLHHDTVETFSRWAADAALPVIAIDNVPGSVIIETFAFQRAASCCLGRKARDFRNRPSRRRRRSWKLASLAPPAASTRRRPPRSRCTPGLRSMCGLGRSPEFFSITVRRGCVGQ